jgi:pimeloyl-ACP methyl ester carboxylesterase
MWLFAFLVLVDSTGDFRIPVAARESLHVSVTGTGEPVVLIPGLFGSTFGFRHVVPRLAALGFRVIVVEPLGIGTSARPAHADYSLTAQAARIAAVLDTLRVHDVIFVAHSLGASMVLRLAYRRPDLARAVVSLEGGPAEAAATPSFRRAMRFAPWIKWFGGVRRIRGKVRSGLLAASGDPRWVTDSVVDAYTAGAASDLDATLRAFLGMTHASEPERLAPHLGEIHCPVRLLLGTATHEGGVPPGDVELLRHGLLFLTVDSVRGSGHYIYEEQPAAVVTAVERTRVGLVLERAAKDPYDQVRAPVPQAAARDAMCDRSPNTTRTRCVAPSSTRGMAAGSTASPSSSAAAIPRQR